MQNFLFIAGWIGGSIVTMLGTVMTKGIWASKEGTKR